MKTKNYPYIIVREIGRPRKEPKEIVVRSWDKNKPKVIFIKDNEVAWTLTKGKEYEIIDSTLISNTDDSLYNRCKRKKSGNNRWYHNMTWYFVIINDKGQKRYYPQELFKITEEKNDNKTTNN